MNEKQIPENDPIQLGSPEAPLLSPPRLESPIVIEDDRDDLPTTGRQKAWLAARVILKRARFILILLAVGMFIGYWDTVKNYWDKWTRPQAVASRQLEPGQEFFCPMHPNVVRSSYEPNGDVPKCPICGMPLSIRKKGEAVPLPQGITGRVQLSPERVQMAGIKTVPVEYRPLVKELTTVGNVTFDEARLSKVVSRVAGYVEKLYVDKTFAVVHQGEPLAEIYSPDLYSAARELLLAAGQPATSNLAASARRKMELLGVGPEEINAILASKSARPRVVIRSPQSGYVIEKKIVAGSSVEMGMTLLEVADLSSVWVEAEVYEKDLPFLQVGQKIEATVEALPNRTFQGTISLIYPRLDTATRTNRVRFALENPDHELRPGMYATVRINSPLETVVSGELVATRPRVVMASGNTNEAASQNVLAVPERAVVDTGTKQIVYVEREPGVFEGVEVKLGPRTEGYYPVLKGLQPGDKIAAAGAFLIDAETRLNPGAASTYFGASGGPQGGGRGSPATAPSSPKPSEQGPTAEVKLKEPTEDDLKNVEELPEEDRQLAKAQRYCPITGLPLGAMGVPVKTTLQGQAVILCCQGCVGKARKAPKETLEKAAKLKKRL